jgi:hypothetical protein
MGFLDKYISGNALIPEKIVYNKHYRNIGRDLIIFFKEVFHETDKNSPSGQRDPD